jgi:hypothetical protein
MKRTRWWRRGLAAVAAALVVVGVVVLVQPLWAFDVLGWAAPDIVWRVDTSEPLVALTFDDGPVPGLTYARACSSSRRRNEALPRWLRYYNHRRPRGQRSVANTVPVMTLESLVEGER